MEENKLDILFLQEIDLKSFMDGMLSFPGFDVFTDGGEKKRTAIVVKKGTFKSVNQLCREEMKSQIWLQAVLEGGQKLFLGNIYREWGEKQEDEMENLCQWVEEKTKQGEVLLAGDFNLDPSRICDSSYALAGKVDAFLTRMEGSDLSRVSFGKTFERVVQGRTIASELDWLLCTQPEKIEDISVKPSGLSDHSLITWKYKTEAVNSTQEKKVGRKLDKINKQAFKADLALAPWEGLAVTESVEDMAEKLQELFLAVLDKHAPFEEIKPNPKFSMKPSGKLKKLRRLRDNARSKKKVEELRILRRECEKLSVEECIENIEKRLEKGSHEAWRVFREAVGKHKGQSQVIIEKEKILDPEGAANVFNEYFPQKIQNIQAGIPLFQGDPLKGAKQHAIKLGLGQTQLKLLPVSEKRVAAAIKKLKASHCPDVYGISPAALKLAPEILAVPLTWVINKTIVSGTVPATWKKGRVIPLHKKSSKVKKENYRPICILPSMSKVMEEVVRSQITTYFEERQILPNSQYGFRAHRSTVLATARVEQDWKSAKQKKLHCGALFFDLSAAFDCIDADLLVEKMKIYGAAENVLRWTKSYLSGRKQRVDFGGTSSREVDITVGSPQGSIVSPLLFLILVADIEEWVSSGIVVGYADDTTVYCIGEDKGDVIRCLERSAIEVLDFMAATRLAANPSKTKYVFFSGKCEKPIKIGKELIEESSEETLLGLSFNKRLTWKSHLNKLKPELLKRIAMLKRLQTKLPHQAICRMIEPIFCAKLRYALELLVDVIKEEKDGDLVLQALHGLHRSAMKAALGISHRQHPSNDDLYNRTGQHSICQMAWEATASLAWKCGQDWEGHPLTTGKVVGHHSGRNTRQAASRSLPPQPTRGTLVARLVEVWEQLPLVVKETKEYSSAKKMIKEWIQEKLIF